jgi:hypothetical protein
MLEMDWAAIIFPTEQPPAPAHSVTQIRNDVSVTPLAAADYPMAYPADLDGAVWQAGIEARSEALRSHYGRMARRLAQNQAIDAWHRQFGCAEHSRCAGCGVEIDEPTRLELMHGALVHVSADYECLISYGNRWRSEAALALRAIGVPLSLELCAIDLNGGTT